MLVTYQKAAVVEELYRGLLHGYGYSDGQLPGVLWHTRPKHTPTDERYKLFCPADLLESVPDPLQGFLNAMENVQLVAYVPDC